VPKNSKNSKSKFDNISLEEISDLSEKDSKKISDKQLMDAFSKSYPDISEELENFWKDYLAYVERVKTEYSKITPEEHKYIHDFIPKNKKSLVLAMRQLGFPDFTESDIKG
jgi:hypothetical protein